MDPEGAPATIGAESLFSHDVTSPMTVTAGLTLAQARTNLAAVAGSAGAAENDRGLGTAALPLITSDQTIAVHDHE